MYVLIFIFRDQSFMYLTVFRNEAKALEYCMKKNENVLVKKKSNLKNIFCFKYLFSYSAVGLTTVAVLVVSSLSDEIFKSSKEADNGRFFPREHRTREHEVVKLCFYLKKYI